MVEKTSIDEQQEDPVINEKILYILKSLPGAGKSTLANIIANEAFLRHKTYAICCADDYFTDPNGKYNWHPAGVTAAHRECRTKFNKAIESKIHIIIIANTNTTKKEYDYYYEEAKKADYFVQVITVGEFSDEAIERYAIQNTHGVTKDILVKMRDRFQY